MSELGATQLVAEQMGRSEGRHRVSRPQLVIKPPCRHRGHMDTHSPNTQHRLLDRPSTTDAHRRPLALSPGRRRRGADYAQCVRTLHVPWACGAGGWLGKGAHSTAAAFSLSQEATACPWSFTPLVRARSVAPLLYGQHHHHYLGALRHRPFHGRRVELMSRASCHADAAGRADEGHAVLRLHGPVRQQDRHQRHHQVRAAAAAAALVATYMLLAACTPSRPLPSSAPAPPRPT
jgi:hypothetical protein